MFQKRFFVKYIWQKNPLVIVSEWLRDKHVLRVALLLNHLRKNVNENSYSFDFNVIDFHMIETWKFQLVSDFKQK